MGNRKVMRLYRYRHQTNMLLPWGTGRSSHRKYHCSAMVICLPPNQTSFDSGERKRCSEGIGRHAGTSDTRTQSPTRQSVRFLRTAGGRSDTGGPVGESILRHKRKQATRRCVFFLVEGGGDKRLAAGSLSEVKHKSLGSRLAVVQNRELAIHRSHGNPWRLLPLQSACGLNWTIRQADAKTRERTGLMQAVRRHFRTFWKELFIVGATTVYIGWFLVSGSSNGLSADPASKQRMDPNLPRTRKLVQDNGKWKFVDGAEASDERGKQEEEQLGNDGSDPSVDTAKGKFDPEGEHR